MRNRPSLQIAIAFKRCIISGTSEAGRMKKEQAPEVPVQFYRSSTGREPVLDWLRSLDRADRRAIVLDLMRVQFGWPTGMPLVRSLKDGLWEVRSSLPNQKIARVLLCFHDRALVVLHGFIKKRRKHRQRISKPRNAE